MSRDPSECCGLCARFSRKEQAQTDMGLGWCSGYDVYVHCTSHPTVLFNPAPREQVQQRRDFIEKFKEATT
jgi:hypothetical protein